MISFASDILALLPTALAPIAVGWGLMIFLRGFRRPRVTLDEQGIDRQPRWAKELGRLTSGWAGLRLGPLVAILGLGLGLLGIFVFPRHRPLLKSPPADPYRANLLEIGYFEWLGVGTVCLGLSLLAYALWSHRSWGVPRCAKCAYPMASIASGVCPECGREHRGVRQLTKPRLLRRALIASILVMLAWPVLAVGVQTKQRYDAQGLYGFIPDWVMIAGMWRLPDDMILGSGGLLRYDNNYPTHGSLVWRVYERYAADPNATLRDKIIKRIVDVLRDEDALSEHRYRAVWLSQFLERYDQNPHLPAELLDPKIADTIASTMLEHLLGKTPYSERWVMSHQNWRVSDSAPWNPAAAVTADDLPTLAQIAFATSPRSRQASLLLLEFIDQRHLFEPVFLDFYANPRNLWVDQGSASHIIEGRLIAESPDIEAIQLQMSMSEFPSTRARAIRMLGSWSNGSDEPSSLPMHIESRIHECFDDPSVLVLEQAIEVANRRHWEREEWEVRALQNLFQIIDSSAPANLNQAERMAIHRIYQLASNYAVYPPEDNITNLRLVNLEFIIRWAAHFPQYRSSWYPKRLMEGFVSNDPDPRVRALAQLYLDTDWDTVPADHREWLPQAIKRALEQAEGDTGQP